MQYPILAAFINTKNIRSYEAATKKIGLKVIDSLEYNCNEYYLLTRTHSEKNIDDE